MTNPIARWLRAASAGIVLSLGFVHVLPEGVQELAALSAQKLNPGYNPAGRSKHAHRRKLALLLLQATKMAACLFLFSFFLFSASDVHFRHKVMARGVAVHLRK